MEPDPVIADHLRALGREVGPVIAEYRRGNQHEALQRLAALIDGYERSRSLSPGALEFLQSILAGWQAALDTEHEPPAIPGYAAYASLLEKAQQYLESGQYDQCLVTAWRLLQYTGIGNPATSMALSMLCDCSSILGKSDLARSAGEMFVSHYRMMNDADLPTGIRLPVGAEFFFPMRAGIHGLTTSEASVWQALLELAVREYPLKSSPLLQSAVKALLEHYSVHGDPESCRRLEELQAGWNATDQDV